MPRIDSISGLIAKGFEPPRQPPLRMMVVGAPGQDADAVGDALGLEDFVFVVYSDLTSDLVEKFAPDIVLSTLIGARFDAIDLALRLQDMGFSGRYRAVSIGVTNPGVILKDIRMAAPAIDFDLFQMDDN